MENYKEKGGMTYLWLAVFAIAIAIDRVEGGRRFRSALQWRGDFRFRLRIRLGQIVILIGTRTAVSKCKKFSLKAMPHTKHTPQTQIKRAAQHFASKRQASVSLILGA